MFKVIRKEDEKVFDVYDVRYDNTTGFAQFLIYEDTQWIIRSAKFFKPYENKKKKLFESNYKDKNYEYSFEVGV